jgi:lambda repressor-like predicted transcriptional regulator
MENNGMIQKMHPRVARVRSALIAKGVTLKALAADAQVSGRFLHYVLKGERTSRKVQRLVAQATGISYRKLWGSPSPQPSPTKGEGIKGPQAGTPAPPKNKEQGRLGWMRLKEPDW